METFTPGPLLSHSSTCSTLVIGCLTLTPGVMLKLQLFSVAHFVSNERERERERLGISA